jgi:aspartate-semialdehyde dehydrogenase
MAARILRGAIVGATSLLGKELADELNQTPLAAWDIIPLDSAEAAGQIAAAGDEAVVIQPITAAAIAGVDVVFFAGDGAAARDHWRAAHAAGVAIVDLTGALEDVPDVLVRSPWVQGGPSPDLATVGVAAGHPAALMLAIAAERLQQHFGLRRMAATVLEPASEQGSAGVDEMHGQTVALLTFKPLVRDVFDAQAAFTMRASLGDAAKANLQAVAARIEREFAALVGDKAAAAVVVQVLQAPVFHGSTASVFVELESNVSEDAVREALVTDILRVESLSEVSNEGVAGKGEIAVAVRAAGRPQQDAMQSHAAPGSAFWLWMAADNLRLTARNAAICGVELAAIRPIAGVN